MFSLFQFVNWLETNPMLGVASFILAIASVVLAFYFYFKSKKVKLPCYAVRSINIVRDLVNKIESLEMLYGGQPIKNLTVSKIAFWNAGNDTINNQDIPIAEPLTIHIKKEYQILDAKILFTKNPANQLTISLSSDKIFVNLKFDYIDKEEGGVIQIIHTGKSNEDIEIHGLIKGVGKINKKSINNILFFPSKPPSAKMRRSMRYFMALTLFGTPFLIISEIFKGKTDLFSSGLLVILYWGLGYFIFKRRLPKGFDIFEDDEIIKNS